MEATSSLPPCAPPVFDIEPTALLDLAQQLAQNTSDLVQEIVKEQEPSFANTILRFIDDENLRLRETRKIQFYKGTHPDKALKDASIKASKLLADLDVDLYRNRAFYGVFVAIKEKAEPLDPEHRYFLQKLQANFMQNGLGGDEKDAQKVGDLLKRLNCLQVEALRNLDSDVTGVWFTKEELAGLPPNFCERKKTKTDLEGTESETRFWVSTKEPDSLPVMKFASKPETRRGMFLAVQNRSPQNIETYRKLFGLRDDAAKAMGFQSHAHLRLQSKIIQSPDTVMQALHALKLRLMPRQEEYIKALLARKAESPNEIGKGRLFLWDWSYYDRIHKEKECQFDAKEVSEYFYLERALEKMLETFENMFGIKIRPHAADARSFWHRDVSLYAIWDETEKFLGWLYIDPHPRDGKYTHFGYFPLQPGCIMSDGTRLYPTTVLVMNFPYATDSKPALLVHDQLRRLFHELGHAIHGVVSKTKIAQFHGPPSGDRDFAEAVAMMFENFLWTSNHMQDISLHYAYASPQYEAGWRALHPDRPLPQKQIPDDLIVKVLRSKNVGIGLSNLWNIWRSEFDMAVHNPSADTLVRDLDLSTLYNRSRKEIVLLDGPDGSDFTWGNGYAGFRAIAAGYDAGYYTYVLSQIYSYDLFYAGFKGHTMDRERGMRYRRLVLEPGGSKMPMEILREFLGREPNDEAFNEEHGL